MKKRPCLVVSALIAGVGFLFAFVACGGGIGVDLSIVTLDLTETIAKVPVAADDAFTEVEDALADLGMPPQDLAALEAEFDQALSGIEEALEEFPTLLPIPHLGASIEFSLPFVVIDGLRFSGGILNHQILQGIGDLRADLAGLLDRQRTSPQHVGERPARGVLHDDVVQPIFGRTGVVHRQDIGMPQRAGRHRLTPKARHELLIARQPAGQYLDSDITIQGWLVRLVHHRHAAFAQQLRDDVLADFPADQRIQLLSSLIRGCETSTATMHLNLAARPHRGPAKEYFNTDR